MKNPRIRLIKSKRYLKIGDCFIDKANGEKLAIIDIDWNDNSMHLERQSDGITWDFCRFIDYGIERID